MFVIDKKVALIILDGWGKGTDESVSAISQANTPTMDTLYEKYPNVFITNKKKS